MKDFFDDPTYIVLNVPAPTADKIKEIRRYFDQARAHMSVEICVTGSNGLGIIAPGQSPQRVFNIIDRIARHTAPFEASFSRVERFPETGIYYYTLENQQPFIELHRKFTASPIIFTPNQFEYHPHCTLKLALTTEYHEEEFLTKIKPPPDEFIINTMSVYSLDGADPKLLHRVNLSGEEI